MGFPKAGVRMSILKHLTIQNALSEFIEKDLLGELMPRCLEFEFQFLWAPVQPAFASPDLQRLAQYASAIRQMCCKATTLFGGRQCQPK